MRLVAAASFEHDVGIRRFEDVFVLRDDLGVPIDERLRRTISLGVVAIEELHHLDARIVDRGRVADDDVADAARKLHVEATPERSVPGAAQGAVDLRLRASRDLVRRRRIERVGHRLGIEAAPRLVDGVAPGLGLMQVTEGAAMHEREVRIVEGVLHQPQWRRPPDLIELRDASECRVGVLGDLEQRLHGIVERDPDIAIAPLARIGLHPFVRHALLSIELRNADEPPRAIILPAVVAADDPAVPAPAFREPGGTMAAAIPQRCRLPIPVEEEDDILTQKAERLWPRLQRVEGHHRVPEAAPQPLSASEHLRAILFERRGGFSN